MPRQSIEQARERDHASIASFDFENPRVPGSGRASIIKPTRSKSFRSDGRQSIYEEKRMSPVAGSLHESPAKRSTDYVPVDADSQPDPEQPPDTASLTCTKLRELLLRS